MQKTRTVILEWHFLTAHYDIFHFVVYPRGPHWYFKVKVDKRYAISDGDSIVHHSPVSWATSAEARNDAQRWLNNRLRGVA